MSLLQFRKDDVLSSDEVAAALKEAGLPFSAGPSGGATPGVEHVDRLLVGDEAQRVELHLLRFENAQDAINQSGRYVTQLRASRPEAPLGRFNYGRTLVLAVGLAPAADVNGLIERLTALRA